MKDKEILKNLEEKLQGYNNIAHLITEVKKSGNIYIMGRALRNYIDRQTFDNIRDLDLVYKSYGESKLDNICTKYNCERNRFNGYKLLENDLSIDIWEYEKSWAIQTGKVNMADYKDTVDVLQHIIALNIDTLLYDIDSERLYDKQYKKLIEQRELDIVLEDVAKSASNIIRVIKFKRELSIGLSERLKKLIKQQYDLKGEQLIEELIATQLHRYNKIEMDKQQLRLKLQNI